MGAADSHIFLSLNGIPKIPLFIFSFKKLSLLRKILIKFFPDDFIFIINKKEQSKKDEEIDLLEQGDKKESESESEEGDGEIKMFSQKLYDKTKLKTKTTIQFDKLKILEKKFFFTLYEYPQSLKKENDYYSIILYGFEENNINFIDGFLNFLLDINYEDNYRFKLEYEKKNNLIEHRYFQSKKGNFYFICINKKPFSEEEVEEINLSEQEEILNFLINEKYFNHFISTNEDNIDYDQFIDCYIGEINNIYQNFFSFIIKKEYKHEFLKSYTKDYNNNKEMYKEIHKYLFDESKDKENVN